MTQGYARSFTLRLCCLLLLSSCGSLLQAQTTEQDWSIRLRSGSLQMPPVASSFPDSLNRMSTTAGPRELIVKFYYLPDEARRQALSRAGIQLLDYLPPRAFIVHLNAALTAPQAEALGIRSIAALPAVAKTDPALGFKADSNAPVSVLVSFYSHTGRARMDALANSLGARLINDRFAAAHALEWSLPANHIAALAENPFVRSISPLSQPQNLNDDERAVTGGALLQAPLAAGGRNLSGSGVTMAIGDDMPALYHIDTRDRVINFNPQTGSYHGQHVSGIAAAAGIMDERGKGMAPKSRILSHLYEGAWAFTSDMFQTYNMTLSNNSYANIVGSCSNAGTYDALANILDQYSLQFPQVQHVFASGNDGSLNCSPYPQSYGTVVGGYQAAKNVIVVGNVEKYMQVRTTSSKGPVKDGRLKPEICALGRNVYSTMRNDAYSPQTGTSQASPAVAGGLALLTERYRQLNGGANPSATLLKALLLNGAQDIEQPGPDYKSGFGLMNLERSLEMMEQGYYQTNTISQSGQQSFTVSVPSGTAQLKVMLYWHDAAANPAATTALVNDLDITVTTPGSVTHQPLILDTTAANVGSLAVEGTDRLNNVEQVVIQNPAAGSYTITVNGFQLPSASQAYVVAYDFIAEGIRISYPFEGTALKAGDSTKIYWEAAAGANAFTLEYSVNNGAAWTVIDNNVPAGQRFYNWQVPAASSGQCLLRISRNGTAQLTTAGPFVINARPALQLSATQCPGYLALEWGAITNASGYEISRRFGAEMLPVDTVTGTSYTFSGLDPDSMYYAAVRPIINGRGGCRSLALRRTPNDGSCAGAISNGDLALDSVLVPQSGRLFTSSALSATEPLSIRVRNLDDAISGNYQIAYSLNNGPWQTQLITTPIAAQGTAIVSFGSIDLSTVGAYNLQLAVTHLGQADPVSANDSMQHFLRQLPNDPLNPAATPFTEDFETMPVLSLQRDTAGLGSALRWDYANEQDTGRIRSLISPSLLIGGDRSMSMDAHMVTGLQANSLTGTFNLATLDTAQHELRLEWTYMLHGRPKVQEGNEVWVRGSDTDPWLHLYYYDTTLAPGTRIQTASLSVTDALSAAGQNFSASFQIRFGQNDTSAIAAEDYGNGLTLDDVQLYTVVDDVVLAAIDTPLAAACNLGSSVPLRILLRNGVNDTVQNIQLYYQLDGGAVVQEQLAQLLPKDSVYYTFSQLLNASAPGAHSLSVWIVAPGDTYPGNDSILNFEFRNQPLIASFPYLQDFESGDGYWYSGGRNSSWAFGTPAAAKISKAASGANAWKTSLNGMYNNLELSYLYSPCFDISGMSSPMLSFSTAMDIEHCGTTLCDGAWVEYTTDNGYTWTRLGASGQGTNWYSSGLQLWHQQDDTRWHVASAALPVSTQTLRLRFVFSSDPGVTREGIAIDDIHIYDRVNSLYDQGATGPLSQGVSGNQWTSFVQSGEVMAQIMPDGQNLGSTEVSVYTHSNIINAQSSQYFLPRSFVVQSTSTPPDSVRLRLFIPDAEVLSLVNASGCNSCTKPADVYELGITKYDDAQASAENGSLADNTNGSYAFIAPGSIRWVPYDNGYYAELSVASFSEFWFNNGGATNAMPLPDAYIQFSAQKISDQHVRIQWRSHADTETRRYELQRSFDGNAFETIHTRNALQQVGPEYTYVDTPGLAQGGVVYYRLRYEMNNGRFYFTPTRRVSWTGPNQLIGIYPNPVTAGQLQLQWSASPGTGMELMLTDVTGRLILREAVASDTWNNNTTIRLPQLARGVYILRVIIGGNRFEEKLLVD